MVFLVILEMKDLNKSHLVKFWPSLSLCLESACRWRDESWQARECAAQSQHCMYRLSLRVYVSPQWANVWLQRLHLKQPPSYRPRNQSWGLFDVFKYSHKASEWSSGHVLWRHFLSISASYILNMPLSLCRLYGEIIGTIGTTQKHKLLQFSHCWDFKFCKTCGQKLHFQNIFRSESI